MESEEIKYGFTFTIEAASRGCGCTAMSTSEMVGTESSMSIQVLVSKEYVLSRRRELYGR